MAIIIMISTPNQTASEANLCEFNMGAGYRWASWKQAAELNIPKIVSINNINDILPNHLTNESAITPQQWEFRHAVLFDFSSTVYFKSISHIKAS
jgi:hypothetical protein